MPQDLCPFLYLFNGSSTSTIHPAAHLSTTKVDNLGSYDGFYEDDKITKKPGDPNKREFTYFVLGTGRFIYASTARLIALKVSGWIHYQVCKLMKRLCSPL